MKDIFKSTPNLNNKDGVNLAGGIVGGGKKSPCGGITQQSASGHIISGPGHARSTSYTAEFCTRKVTNSQNDKQLELRNRAIAMELERNVTKFGGAGVSGNSSSSAGGGVAGSAASLSRSRSAQSLKLLGDTATQVIVDEFINKL